MKIPENHGVCELCREVVPLKTMKEYVRSVEWGSFSGRPNHGPCCAECRKTKCDKSGYVIGRPYA